MKAVDSIRNKIKKPSLSTALFWVGSLITLLAAFLPLITGAQLLLFLVAIVGFALSGWQKIVGDREQSYQLEQERKRNEAVAQNKAIHSTELRIESNVNDRAPDTMPTRESQDSQKRNDT
jgi:uncharacterized membrane protein